MIYEVQGSDKMEAIFGDWQETLIWSCLQGCMGHLYVTSPDVPVAAKAFLGDFCFLAGEPDKTLVLHRPDWCTQDFLIMVPQNENWGRLIEECYGEKAKRVTRYAIKKEGDIFDRNRLQEAVRSLPAEYELRMMDRKLFHHCRQIPWCRDWVSQYDTWELYQKYGLGAIILKDGEPVSGASSYSGYMGGIEIEIDTKAEFRRKGLAYVSGAKLILECLDRGWYPSWDAQNKWSVALAEKLGYHFEREYPAYEIGC